MKILFPIYENRIDGPENWRRDLFNGLKNTDIVTQTIKRFNFNFISKIIGVSKIHVYRIMPSSLFYIIFSKLFGKKVIFTLHGNIFEEKLDKKGIKKILWIPGHRLAMYISDKIVVPSKYLFDEIVKGYPKLKDKLVVIPNFVDMTRINKYAAFTKSQLGLNNHDFLVLEITSFNQKMKAEGLDILIDSFNKLNQSKRRFVLFIIGRGKYFNEYKEKYSSVNIKFLGFRKDALSYLKACDLFAHYSKLETFGLVVLEAVACNKPVVSLENGAVKDILPQRNLIKISDVFGLKRAVMDITSKENHFKASSTLLSRYNLRRITNRYARVYKEV